MTRASVYTVSNSITSRCRDCGLLFDGKVDTSHTCPRGGRRAQNNSTNTTKRSNSIKKKTTSAKCSNNTNIIAAYTDKAAAKKRIEDAIARLKNKTPSTTAAKTPGHPNFESLVANLEKPLPNARISSVHAIQKYQLSKNGESSNQPSREESRLKSSSMLKYDDMMKDLSRELQIIEERRLKVVSSSSKVKNPRCGGCLSTILHRGSAFKIDALSKWFHPDCFKCDACNETFSESLHFVPHEGKAYCEKDYETIFRGSVCAACDKTIQGNPAHALGLLFHPEHLKCKRCEEVITGPVFEHNNTTYCEADYAEHLAPRCKGCAHAITGETVCALGGQYHTKCFTCTTCASNFPDNNFYVLEEKPYCKLHYHQTNGSLCGGCSEPIEGECAEIAELNKKYHPACWTCHSCKKPLSDTYYSYEGAQLCERDMLVEFEKQLQQDLDFKAKASKRSTRIIELN